MRLHLTLIASILALLATAATPVETTPTGIIVNHPMGKVRLSVYGDDIIRVSATPEADFADTPSLVTLEPQSRPHFSVEQTDTTATLVTAGLRAVVSLSDGTVSFRRPDGTLIATEAAGGRSFKPITVEGTKGYTVRQVWESASDSEGLYGLGQHQSDEWNYKGRSEELFQYNTKVSVPFILSTEGYGILWDSYSLCRFGNPEAPKQLGEVFRIYDDTGKPGALTGRYTPKGSELPTIERREDSIYFEHLRRRELKHVVNLPEDFRYRDSHVTYTGSIEAPEEGTYTFVLYYSGYMSVWIDGKNVVPERWRTSWNPNTYKFSVTLPAGRRVPLSIDWRPNGDVAYCGLRAYSPRPREEEMQLSWWSEMQPQEDYYFIAGRRPDDVIAGYRSLTGKAPVMPRWVTGFWQSREKYNTSAEVLSTLSEFRRRHIPMDNIVIDWLHWPQDSWGSHEFDPKRFPDPCGMVDSIHAMHSRVMVSVWPKFYVTTEHFREFDERGWMYRLPVNDSIRDWVGPGYLGSFYDAYSPEARKLFWSQINDHYVPLGFDAWWMDASEPNIRDCTDIQYRKDLITPTALGPSTQYFNAYGLVNADAIYNGQRGLTAEGSVDPDRRVFLLTRSGFAGQQRYSTATWSGDIATRWEDMKAQISAGLNFASSGIPWWSMDIGGFCVEDRYVAAAKRAQKGEPEDDDMAEWRELNTRWYQFGAFAPMFRAHGQWPRREVWNIAPEGHLAYESIVHYMRLRYALMPYIYSLNGMVHRNDYTIMRPMYMDHPADMAMRSVADQYMFGPALLVAPVYTYGARQRSVALPEGYRWYDFYSGEAVNGGQTIEAPAPYNRIPLYVRSGSIIPYGPEIEWSDQRPADVIELWVYTGRDGEFTIYEDDNTTYGYEHGLFSTIPLAWDDATSTLRIGRREGEFPGMLRTRRFRIVKVTPTAPCGYTPAPAATLEITYDGRLREVKL